MTREPDQHEPETLPRRRKRRRSRGLRNASALVIAVAVYVVIQILGWESFRVVSDSMEGTLLAGDRVLASKLIYGARLPGGTRLPAVRAPTAGDVVIFRHPEQPDINVIKRCVAVGGQTVELRDGRYTIDGEPDRWDPALRDHRGRLTPVAREVITLRVPDGMLFVLGDNREESSDSRDWGFVPLDDVIGRAEIIVWSREQGDGIRWNRIGDRVR